ncbi:hypothetical protein BIY26_07125 [Brenneria goodwinii]|uniref:Uncharacterized protein n=1 Tax=Brenneria goodwinii TaxID=1109412 RepID=A0AAE8EUI3_9GAMM|nr:hypothetical protein [Brenneria goodwinii]ATA26776.1 hypothetical protein AWC36_23220 [Brenneria goodwinii]RLM26764.1 hypothetical protein BIY26_07125 [Brenneria goodwinii]
MSESVKPDYVDVDYDGLPIYRDPPAVPDNGVTAEHRRVIKMLLDICEAAFELADDSCQQEIDGELCHVVPDDSFAKLSDALDEIENTLPDEYEYLPNTVLQWAAVPRHALRSLLQLSGNSGQVLQHSDDEAFDRFAIACKAKLAKSRAKGRRGWDDPHLCSVESLAVMLVAHLVKGNSGTFEDVGNFAMMLHQRKANPKVLSDAVKADRFTPAERAAIDRALDGGKPVATVRIQSGRLAGNKFNLVYSPAIHDLPDDVYYLYTEPVRRSYAVPDGLRAAINKLFDNDGSRGRYSAIACGDAHREIEAMLAASPPYNGMVSKQENNYEG